MADLPNVFETAAGNTGSAAKADTKKTGKLKRIEIEPTDNGGYIVNESYASDNKDMYGSKTVKKVAADKKDLDGILDECLGLSDAYSQEAGSAEEQ